VAFTYIDFMDNRQFCEAVTNDHPFKETGELRKQQEKFTLFRELHIINWKEISSEEYDLFKKHNN